MRLTTELLTQLKPIQGLSSSRLQELARLCEPQDFPAGADPWEALRGAARFIYLLAGELKLVLPDGSTRLLVGGCDEALWPLGARTILPVSSKAVTKVCLLSIDFHLLDIMMAWDSVGAVGQFGEGAQTDAGERPARVGASFLTNGALAELPPAHIHALLNCFVPIPVRQGQTIIHEGDAGDYFYLIQNGRAAVSRVTGGAKLDLANLKAGDTFGEEALVSGEKRNATVCMSTDGVLLRLCKQDFKALLQAPLLHSVTAKELEARLGSGALWLDVRFPAEFAEKALPGAMNVPLNEIRTAFQLLDPTQEYLVYCQNGRRSSVAAYLLAQHGFKASWLAGGLEGLELP